MALSLSQSDTRKANPSQSATKAGVFPATDPAMSQRGDGPSRKSIWQRGLPSFARWNKPRRSLFFLLVLAANVLLATLAWIIVRLVAG
jgi:hypothetical protein